MRYRFTAERALLRVISITELEHDVLTFRYREEIRRWLPGYMFIRIDLEQDYWQQLMRAPGVVELLGDPTPISDDVYYDFRARCPSEVLWEERTIVPIGSNVEVLDGPMHGQRGEVVAQVNDDVMVEMEVFSRATQVRVAATNVMILR